MSSKKEPLVLEIEKTTKDSIILKCPFCNSLFSISIKQLRAILDKGEFKKGVFQ